MEISAIQITDRQHQKAIDAELISDLPDRELQLAENLYKSYRVQAMRNYLRNRAPIPQSNHWNWSTKRDGVEPERLRFFGIRCEAQMQGLMLLRLDPVPSRRPDSHAEQALYVEYIESAPWNQSIYTGGNPRFGAVGIQLLRAAGVTSMEAGHNGRLALHSLPQSEGFYRPHFIDLGVDKEYTLRWFELDNRLAETLIKGK